jgi:uncharacterized membrane protein
MPLVGIAIIVAIRLSTHTLLSAYNILFYAIYLETSFTILTSAGTPMWYGGRRQDKTALVAHFV